MFLFNHGFIKCSFWTWMYSIHTMKGENKQLDFIDDVMKTYESTFFTFKGAGYDLLQLYRYMLWELWQRDGVNAVEEVLRGVGNNKQMEETLMEANRVKKQIYRRSASKIDVELIGENEV